MNRVLANFCECKNTLGFSSVECMFSMPAICNELMLRKIIEPSDNHTILDPDDELRELPSGSKHSIPKSKYHLVSIEDITRILLAEIWNDWS